MTVDSIGGVWWLREAESNVPHGQWASEAALTADAATAVTLVDHHTEQWRSMDAETRGAALAGIPSALDRCPVCDGQETFDEETFQPAVAIGPSIASLCGS